MLKSTLLTGCALLHAMPKVTGSLSKVSGGIKHHQNISMMIMNHNQIRGIKFNNDKAGKSQKGQSLFTRQKPSVTFLEEIPEPYAPKLYKMQTPSSSLKDTLNIMYFQFRKFLSKARATFRIYRRLGSQFGISGNAKFQQQVLEYFQEYKRGIASNDLKRLNKVCTARELNIQKKEMKHSEGKHQIEVTANSKPKIVHSCVLDLPGNKEVAQVIVLMDVNEKLYTKEDLPGGKHQLHLVADKNNVYHVVFEKHLDDFSKQWMIAGFLDSSKKYVEPSIKEVLYGASVSSLSGNNK